jgi:hypothetical protein
VLEAFQGLAQPGTEQQTRESLDDTLEALIAYGDILEESDIRGETEASAAPGARRTLLYAAPPAFVWRQQAGTALLVGVTPDHVAPFAGDLADRIELRGHARFLRQRLGEDLRGQLEAVGLIPLTEAAWMRLPPTSSPEALVREYRSQLRALPGGLTEVTILDPSKSVRYYRGRWVPPAGQSGTFVARWPQAYGSDRWYFVELVQGEAKRWLELPTIGSRLRGCDEAWHLQAAIDAVRGVPQQYRVRQTQQSDGLIDVFAPLPLWAQRRWDLFGTQLPRGERRNGSLFTYRFSAQDVQVEEQFLLEYLWMRPVTD